jgi:2-polyprenyl-6-methoxyphenol hydroxylase-like FAD-dependent oxidoreductase
MVKIIIVGAGLSGLATAISLHRYVKPPNNESLEITIYERADPNDTGSYGFSDHSDLRLKNQGAAISLQPNALRVLRDLSPDLADKVHGQGYPCTHFTWKTAGDYLFGRDYLDLLPISRPILVQCLVEALPPSASIKFRTVVAVPRNGPGTQPSVEFEDGSQEPADLIIGADGIRSPLRQSLFADNPERAQAQYLGVCAVGGVLDMPLPKDYLNNSSIVFALGASGVFGYCGLSKQETGKLLYFSFYDKEEIPERRPNLPQRGY